MGFLSDLFGGGKATTSNRSEGTRESTVEREQTPWEPQQQYLENLWYLANAEALRPEMSGKNIFQKGADQLYNAATGYGETVPQQYFDVGMGLSGGLGQAQDYYQGMLADGTEGISRGVLNYADTVMNSDLLQSQIDAANRDVARDLYENQLPGIASNAAVGMNLSSSARGAADAIARRGAEDRMADTSAAMRSAAFNNALAQGMQAQNLLSSQAGNLGNLGSAGMGFLGQGMTYGMQPGNALMQAGLAQQGFGWTPIQNLSGIVQTGNWGGQQTTTEDTKTTGYEKGTSRGAPDYIGGIASLAGGAGGFLTGLGNFNNPGAGKTT